MYCFKNKLFLALIFSWCFAYQNTWAQCGGQIMEPGFSFLSSSRGCAPFTVQIQTLFLASTPGTEYYINWGDGTPEELYTQTNPTGVTISHPYPNSPVDCGYNVIIDAANTCNPRGSVVPIETQVVVWTNDVISMDPGVFRVCQGYATDVTFIDNSDWNCYPRATRENGEARWIQWIYGTNPPANFIPGIQVNSVTPGAFPYLDPLPSNNPIYPVLSPGQVSLPIHIPATLPADIGKEFELTLKNWNQCNPYDLNLTDGNFVNPVNGNVVDGDSPPQITTGRIVIVDAPAPDFLTRSGGLGGAVQTIFCIDELIYFDNNTPAIAGALFNYTWEFYDNSAGTGVPVTSNDANPTHSYPTSGQKLIRLRVRDDNAAGNCEASYQAVVTVSPSLVAQIQTTDLLGAVIVPDFCQEIAAPFTSFSVRFADVSVGTITANTQWRWEFYDENNSIIRQEPAGGGFSAVPLGPFTHVYSSVGSYRIRLIIQDNITSCQSVDEVRVRVFEKPEPAFTFTNACEGSAVTFTDNSTLNSIGGQQIVMREWDMSYDGVTFTKDPTLDNEVNFNHVLGPAGTYTVALRVTTDLGGCSAVLTRNVVVDPLPVANFLPDVTSGCSVLEVDFTNNSITTQPASVVVDQYVWEINDGSGFQIDSVQRPSDPQFGSVFTKRFTNTGTSNVTFAVRLRVVTVNNCERVSGPITITVFPAPKSGFISVNYSPFDDNCSPRLVNFTVDNATQALSPSEFLWNINDANGLVTQVSTGTTPAFNYNFVNATQSVQNYFVTLRARLSTGCYGDSTRIIRINPLPLSDFTITPLVSDCNVMRVQFDALQKGLNEYEWTIEVNGIPTLVSTTLGDRFEHTFSKTSTNQAITVRLKTANFANCESVVTSQPLSVPARPTIMASFNVSPLIQSLPNTTVAITNTSSPGPWNYLWDFGDGTTSTDPAIQNHMYATHGTYSIKLSVSQGDCVETQTTTVQITPIPPVLDFEYHPSSGCAPLLVNFTNLSQYADPSTYRWEFGANQGTSNATNPTYTYYEPGTYSVTLSAESPLGGRVQITKQMAIEVYNKPSASFSLKPQIVYIPGGKLFTKNDSYGATQYLWDFGDGTTSDEVDPIHTYTTPGVFDITLIAYTTQQCSDTATIKTGVRVLNGGELLIPNAFTPSTSGPDGTGENDIFIPLMRGVTKFEMMVFNRWGQMLFETKNPDLGWDGYFNGVLCAQDVYVYKIIATYANGEKVTKVGDIQLIR